jgi:hypothetical protein
VDLNRIVQGLKAERDVLAAAIESLERLAAGRGRKRGRPPAWLNASANGEKRKRQSATGAITPGGPRLDSPHSDGELRDAR